jgi:hypothetical protein
LCTGLIVHILFHTNEKKTLRKLSKNNSLRKEVELQKVISKVIKPTCMREIIESIVG